MPTIYTYVFANIAPAETTATKRVDADRVMADLYAIEDAVAMPYAAGAHAVDGNSEGVSDAANCRLTIYTEEIAGEGRVGGLLALNDYVQVTDGTSVWSKKNTVLVNELSFTAADLADGAGPADYSDAGFIDSLDINIIKFREFYGKNQLILAGAHAQKVTGSDMETSSTDTTKIGTALPAVKTQIDVAHETDGAHSADVISAANIAPNALLYENDANLVRGTMDYDSDKDGRPDGWEDYNTPTSVELSVTQVKEGTFSAKIVGSQPSDGIKNRPDENPIDPDLFKGKSIAFAVWVYCATSNTAKIEIYDGVDTTPSAAGGTAGSWARIYVVHTVNAAATEITPRVYVTEATTIYVDAVMLCLGELAAGFTPHVNEVVYARIADASLTNYCLNSDFEEWSSGIGNFPDLWNGTGQIIRDTPPLFSPYCAGVTLDAGETAYMEIPYHMTHFHGRDVYFNAYIILDSGTLPIRMKINDGTDSSYADVIPIDSWQRRGVKHTVNATASGYLKIEFLNPGGSQIQFRVNGVTLTVDNAPMGYKPATIYKPFLLTYGMAGAITTGVLATVGGVTEEVPVPFPGIIQSIFVKQGMAVGATTENTYTVYKNVVQDTDYAVVLINTEDAGSDGVAIGDAATVVAGDTIGVRVAVAGANPGGDAVAVVKGITWS